MRLDEELDATAFAAAFEELVSRHETLRARFDFETSEPALEILDRVDVEVAQLDWSSGTDARAEDELAHYLRADRDRGFDMRRAPLARLASRASEPRAGSSSGRSTMRSSTGGASPSRCASGSPVRSPSRRARRTAARHDGRFARPARRATRSTRRLGRRGLLGRAAQGLRRADTARDARRRRPAGRARAERLGPARMRAPGRADARPRAHDARSGSLGEHRRPGRLGARARLPLRPAATSCSAPRAPDDRATSKAATGRSAASSTRFRCARRSTTP